MNAKLCRFCCTLTTEPVHVLKAPGLRAKIETCLPLILPESSSESPLPEHVCPDCVSKLDSFHSYIQLCLENTLVLESQFAVKESCLRTRRKCSKASMATSACFTNTVGTQTEESGTGIDFADRSAALTESIAHAETLLRIPTTTGCSDVVLEGTSLVGYECHDDSEGSDGEGEEMQGATMLGEERSMEISVRCVYNGKEMKRADREFAAEMALRRKARGVESRRRMLDSLLPRRVQAYTRCPRSRRKGARPRRMTPASTMRCITEFEQSDSEVYLEQTKQETPVDITPSQTVCLLCDAQLSGALNLTTHVYETHGIDMLQVIKSTPVPESSNLRLQDLFLSPQQAALLQAHHSYPFAPAVTLPPFYPYSVTTNAINFTNQTLNELTAASQLTNSSVNTTTTTHNNNTTTTTSAAATASSGPTTHAIHTTPPSTTASIPSSSDNALMGPQPSDAQQHQCPHCPAAPLTQTELFVHLRVKHPSIAGLTCGLCLAVLGDRDSLEAHVRHCALHLEAAQHPGRYMCTVCMYADDSGNAVEMHVAMHDFLLADCAGALRVFDPSDYVEARKSGVVGATGGQEEFSKSFTCQECDHRPTFEHFREYSTHRRTDHQIFHCDLCTKFYGRNSHLWKHVNRLHKGHPSITCHFCRKTSASKYHLLQHFNKVHVNRPSMEEDFLSKKFDGFDFQSVKQRFMLQDIMEKSLLKEEPADTKSDESLCADTVKEKVQNIPKRVSIIPANPPPLHATSSTTKSGSKSKTSVVNGMSPSSLPTALNNAILQSPSTCKTAINVTTHEQTTPTTTQNHNNSQPGQTAQQHQCPKCLKRFPKRTLLRKHRKNCRPRPQKDLLTRCKSCARVFKDRSSLAKHLVNNHSVYTCEICAEQVESKCAIVSHIRFTHPDATQLVCPCGNILRSCSDLRIHLSDHENSFVCQYCGDMLASQVKMKMHVLSLHRSILGRSCGLCLMLFDSQVELCAHVRSEHGAELRGTSCTVCGKSYGSRWKAFDHMTKSHGREFHTCRGCLAVFAGEDELQRHEALEHRASSAASATVPMTPIPVTATVTSAVTTSVTNSSTNVKPVFQPPQPQLLAGKPEVELIAIRSPSAGSSGSRKFNTEHSLDRTPETFPTLEQHFDDTDEDVTVNIKIEEQSGLEVGPLNSEVDITLVKHTGKIKRERNGKVQRKIRDKKRKTARHKSASGTASARTSKSATRVKSEGLQDHVPVVVVTSEKKRSSRKRKNSKDVLSVTTVPVKQPSLTDNDDTSTVSALSGDTTPNTMTALSVPIPTTTIIDAGAIVIPTPPSITDTDTATSATRTSTPSAVSVSGGSASGGGSGGAAKRTVYVHTDDGTPSRCEICAKEWPAKKHLWQHYIRCHKPAAATVCGICLCTNGSYAQLQRHLHQAHPTLLHGQGFGSNFICRICGRYHNASSKLRTHMAIHSNFDFAMLTRVEEGDLLLDDDCYDDDVGDSEDHHDVLTSVTPTTMLSVGVAQKRISTAKRKMQRSGGLDLTRFESDNENVGDDDDGADEENRNNDNTAANHRNDDDDDNEAIQLEEGAGDDADSGSVLPIKDASLSGTLEFDDDDDDDDVEGLRKYAEKHDLGVTFTSNRDVLLKANSRTMLMVNGNGTGTTEDEDDDEDDCVEDEFFHHGPVEVIVEEEDTECRLVRYDSLIDGRMSTDNGVSDTDSNDAVQHMKFVVKDIDSDSNDGFSNNLSSGLPTLVRNDAELCSAVRSIDVDVIDEVPNDAKDRDDDDFDALDDGAIGEQSHELQSAVDSIL